MKKLSLVQVIIFLLLISCQKSPGPDVENGVSKQLAEWRSKVISNLSYQLHFDIPEERDQPIPAQVIIRFDLSDGEKDLQLDFKAPDSLLKNISVNDHPVEIIHHREHIIIPGKHFLNKQNTILIAFTAGEQSLNRNDEYLYTLLVPDRARTLFPAFDQPNLKARFNLSLTIPSHWEAVSNGKLQKSDTTNDEKRLEFQETKPLSTYLFAFAAGRFKRTEDTTAQMTMYYRETDSVKVERNIRKIFDLHRSALDWLENYTDIQHPFGKFDFVLIPSFQYGGMEHPGAIYYKESSLLLDEGASVNDELDRASLIAHETAHMWFGNLVTMKWFDDVWMKEVFANLMAAKIVHPNFPDMDHEVRFLLSHYPAAYAIDRSEGTHPIQQKLNNLNSAGTLYGGIIYKKAPIVMSKLETMLEETPFRSGIRDYLSMYSYGNATWDQLIAILKGFTSIDLEQWNQDWMKKGGMPIIDFNGEYPEYEVKVEGPSGRIWPQKIGYLFDGTEKIFEISQPITQVELSQPPQEIVPNFDGRGYGYFPVKEGNVKEMLMIVHQEKIDLRRSALWVNLWEYTLRGILEPEDLLKHTFKAIQRESNPLLLNYIAGRAKNTYWKFTPTTSRQDYALELEEILRDRLQTEEDMSIRRTLWNTYKSVFLSQKAIEHIKTVWEEQQNPYGISLSEGDYIELAAQLALRLPNQADTILNLQLQRTTNPDRKKRLEFIMPALSAEKTVRDNFFESLHQPENREHESWVADAVSYLHHPLRANESIQYLKPSLELVEEIQQTGDIFFPKRWLSSTLWGHNTEEAAEIVGNFLLENPELSSNLRNKVLQSADLLFRASRTMTTEVQQ